MFIKITKKETFTIEDLTFKGSSQFFILLNCIVKIVYVPSFLCIRAKKIEVLKIAFQLKHMCRNQCKLNVQYTFGEKKCASAIEQESLFFSIIYK